tara:strand:+ start:423 stop:527 length:105 start_codon:yes stop_codon:yes gene_type:complete
MIIGIINIAVILCAIQDRIAIIKNPLEVEIKTLK